MRLLNTSRYDDHEVAELVKFGFRGVADGGVEVHVKNSRHAYRGIAYHGVPSMARVHGKTIQLVTIGIGAASRFPVTNMTSTLRWVRLDPDDDYDPAKVRSVVRVRAGVEERYLEERREVHHPYGGTRSPLIELHDWREALVATAAHEARHVQQRQRGKRMSEVDAERHALRRLTAWREAQ